jgi:hypothetical protein
MWILSAIALTGAATAITASSGLRQVGWGPFGSFTNDAGLIGSWVFIGIICWLQGHGAGVAAGARLGRGEEAEREREDQARAQQLSELIHSARVDVTDALRLSADQQHSCDGLRYLDSVLEDGSLSVRLYDLATDGLLVEPTDDQELAAVTSSTEPKG